MLHSSITLFCFMYLYAMKVLHEPEIRTILITGCSSGIGRGIASVFIQQGWKVFATARNPLDIIDFSQMGATTLALDVTSDDSVNAAAEYVTKKHGSLDVLVNNAGFGIYGPLEELPIEKAKKQFETNVFGLARVTNAFLPLLRLGNRPLIVNISSVAGLAAMPLGGWYCASKYAVEALSDTYRTELHKFGIKTVLVEPGPVVSNFSKVGFKSLDYLPKESQYPELMQFMANWRQRSKSGKPKTPEDLGRLVLRITSRRNPGARYLFTGTAYLVYFMSRLLPVWLFDRVILHIFNKKTN